MKPSEIARTIDSEFTPYPAKGCEGWTVWWNPSINRWNSGSHAFGSQLTPCILGLASTEDAARKIAKALNSGGAA